MKIGFEREFFVKSGKEFVLCPAIMPHDECGYLAESRGEPNENPLFAAYLLLAAEDLLLKQAKRNRVALKLHAAVTLPQELLRDALRRNGKASYPSERANIYGLDYAAGDTSCRAGLHVHFSNQITFQEVDKKHPSTYNGFLDIPKIVRVLDDAFAEDIARSQRIRGFYELKVHGVEYRSLPATVDPRKVATLLLDADIS